MSIIYYNELGWRVKNEFVFVYYLEFILLLFNFLFYLLIFEGDCMLFLMINGIMGDVYILVIFDRDDYFNLLYIGWCNVIIKVCLMFYILMFLVYCRGYIFLIWMVFESYFEFILLFINKFFMF